MRRFIRIFHILTASILISFQFPAAAKSLGEALGFNPDDKVLLIHADDMGSVDSANAAIADLLKAGAVKSTSIMLPCPAQEAAIQYANANPSADIGVHLTLTSEWQNYRWGPVLPGTQVPSLLAMDSDDFHDGLFWLFVWGREPDANAEMEAQIKAAIAGWHPTHIDTHMGSVFLRPSWLYAYLNLARKYQLPPMIPRWSSELKQDFFGSVGGDMMDAISDAGIFSAPAILQGIENAGFLPLDYLYMYPNPISKTNDFAGRKQFYINMLKNLQPGVSQIIIHPAYDDGDFYKIMSSNPEQILRDYEAQIFQDPDVIALIKSLNIHLIGWRQIDAVYDWSQVQEMKDTGIL